MNYARTALLVLAAWAGSSACAAATLDECPAKKYKPCASFTTSRTINEHTPLIDGAAEFTRSKGSWTIHVSYGPPEKCAKVFVALDAGPLDFHLDYKRVFRNGTGTISESGTFMHRTHDVEEGLRIATTSCRVPDDESERLEDDEQERREWEAERERLEWEAERERLAREAQAHERLALEAARERQALEVERQRLVQEAQHKRQEVERQRLAQEADRKRREAQRSLAQAKREREQEQERQRLARERERIREEAEAAEIARMERQYMEMQRRKEQEDTVSTGDILSGIATGIGIGALVGAAVSGDKEVFGAASQLLSSVAGGYSPGSAGGSSCEQIGVRMAQGLERLSNSNSGMCAIYRGTARIYRQTRSELTAAGCPMAGFDEAIRQAEAGGRGACD